ncbi:MAG: NAD(P)/FAD-dependent oxidoreductase, partial [Thiolinea sp.]
MNNNTYISLWDKSSVEVPVSVSLDGDLETDVAIVGGGFTGLSTALHLAQRGRDCLVLEAEKIGFGGSGRNVGLVNAGLWLPPQDVRKQLGDKYGTEFVRILGDAPAYVFSLIERYQMQCEPTQTGTIHAAHSLQGYDDLARRAEEWQRLGANVDLLSKEQANEKIGSKVFYGGLLDHRAGTINPMGYVRGLARAAQNEGAQIRTSARVIKLEQVGQQWRLHTERGVITANKVVLGTNAYSDDLWPGLKQTFTRIHYFQLATDPLGDKAAHILRERQGLWDTGKIMFSVRRDAFGRIIIGSMGRIVGGQQGLSVFWAKRNIKRLFPELGTVDIEKAWFGQIAMTPDHLPRIHRLAPGLYTPIGYNGRGITPGTIFGRAMAELLDGGDEAELPLPVSELGVVGSAPV